MKKKQIYLLSLSITACVVLQAQVGVNTQTPKTTLHVIPTKTDATTAEGIIAPNLTRAQLISKDVRYTTDQKGAIVYVTAADGTVSTKTTKITQVGYYYFDGALWQPFASLAATVTTANNGLTMNGTTTQLGGTLVQPTTITGTATNNLKLDTPTTVAKTFKYTGTTPTAGHVLKSDADGNAYWGSTVSAASNGLTMNSTTTQLGGTLVQPTTITGTATNNLKLATPTTVSGLMKYTNTTPVVGQYLRASNVDGSVAWATLPAATVTTANNGLTMNNTTTQLGGTLVQPTTITGTATNNLKLATPTTVSGLMKYTNTTPVVGQYLRASNVDGSVAWATLPAAATTEPWQVQGSTTLATTNAQSIFQTGSVAVGSNTSGTYKFQVTGTSNITGNSRVGTSTVVGAETVGGTLGVTGVATMNNNLIVTGNTGLGTSAPSQKLHIVGNEYVTGISKVGGSSTLNASAQLELGDIDKGLAPNRVSLISPGNKAPISNPVNGMIVYNIASVPAEGLSPGFYYWRTNTWVRLLDVIPQSTINVLDLQSECTSLTQMATETEKGALMNWGTITIPEDGSYAFSFRLYGSTKSRPAANNMSFYYIALLANGTLEDTAEMDIIHGSNSHVLTYSITLGAQLKAGDKITFRLSHNPASPNPWALSARPGLKRADRTSMVWWKL